MGGSKYAGEEINYSDVRNAVVSLTLFAPLLGPISDRGYQEIRHQFGLPRVPEYRRD